MLKEYAGNFVLSLLSVLYLELFSSLGVHMFVARKLSRSFFGDTSRVASALCEDCLNILYAFGIVTFKIVGLLMYLHSITLSGSGLHNGKSSLS